MRTKHSTCLIVRTVTRAFLIRLWVYESWSYALSSSLAKGREGFIRCKYSSHDWQWEQYNNYYGRWLHHYNMLRLVLSKHVFYFSSYIASWWGNVYLVVTLCIEILIFSNQWFLYFFFIKTCLARNLLMPEANFWS